MPELKEIVNKALDQERTNRNLTSDQALAKALGVGDVTIYRWRNIKISKTTKILLASILGQHQQSAN